MFAFVAPGGLIALAALAVPIALHLWSRRTGRPLRIGSIALFAAAPPPATRRPQIEDMWLLLLRCGVLAALALALAGPYWRGGGRAAGATWVLVTEDIAAAPASQPLLDSLRSAGAEQHTLGPGPIWSLLREADYTAPPGTRFVVVAPNRGAMGERPRLRAEVELLGLTTAPAPDRSPQSTPLRTVLIYSDAGRRDDARYVTAALQAAAQATRRPAVIIQRDAATTGSVTADWIVWLAARPVPDVVLERARRGATLLTDALADAPRDLPGRLRLAAASDPGLAAPLVRQRTTVPAGGAPVWTDDAGRPMLTVERDGAGQRLRFYARFHPSWGDLVLHPAFPEAIAALWAGDNAREPDVLNHLVVRSQLLPARDTSSVAGVTAARIDLYHAFWLAGLLLFLLERWIARRTRAVAA